MHAALELQVVDDDGRRRTGRTDGTNGRTEDDDDGRRRRTDGTAGGRTEDDDDGHDRQIRKNTIQLWMKNS